MSFSDTTHRRGFLGRILGASVAAASLPVFGGVRALAAQRAAAPPAGPDDWIARVTGTHRCLFDFPQHKSGVPLLHMLNYLNTYSSAYKTPAKAVGTFYGIGPQSSIPLGVNDAMWAKYALGDYMGLKDTGGKPYTRNLFFRPTANELHLVAAVMQTPNIPAFAEAMPSLGIESLQKMGSTFLLCANALDGWCAELEARKKGKADDIEKEFRANLLPGVVVVPAMVIAIEKAQAAGIRYNRQ